MKSYNGIDYNITKIVDAQYELQKEYGQDIETLLATQVTGELAHRKLVA